MGKSVSHERAPGVNLGTSQPDMHADGPGKQLAEIVAQYALRDEDGHVVTCPRGPSMGRAVLNDRDIADSCRHALLQLLGSRGRANIDHCLYNPSDRHWHLRTNTERP